MAGATRSAMRSVAGAVALATTTIAGAGEPARLAATLVTPGEAAALVELAGVQVWLRAGESAGDCRMARVEATAADMDCAGRRIRLALEPGRGDNVPQPAPAGLASATLPPGTLRSLAARPQAIALAADFEPVVEHGRLLGWRVARLDASGPLAGLGLREADVVRAIDGAPAAEPAAFAAAIRALPDAQAFTLELSREAQPLTLVVAAPPAPQP